jgi:hypothetical protein
MEFTPLSIACPVPSCRQAAGSQCITTEYGWPTQRNQPHATRVFQARRAARQAALAAGARGRFSKGMAVRLSEEGRRVIGPRRPRTGTVVGFGHQPHLVQVLMTGNRHASSFSMVLWEPDTDGTT